MTKKQAYYFLAVKEIIELFAEQEIGGQCEVNIDAVLGYITSDKFINDSWGLNSKEEIYKLVTDDILAGYPVWQLLELSDRKKDMLERELADATAKARLAAEKKYCCYRCRWFKEHNTSFGMLQKCERPIERRYQDWHTRKDDFKLKQRCKNFEETVFKACKDCEHTEDECDGCYPELGYKNDKMARDTKTVEEYARSEESKILMEQLATIP